ncbi:MAG TPA: response regulator transcription factor [Chthoniobacterales bacterium]
MKPTRSITAHNKHAARVIIADDHVLLRELIVHALSNINGHFRFIAEVDTVSSALQNCIELEPELLILNLSLLTHGDQSAIARVKKRVPDVNVLVYASALINQTDISLAIRSGVNGCVGKSANTAEFIAALERTQRGENYFCGEASRLLSEIAMGQHRGGGNGSLLSPREMEMLQLIADGKTSKQAARTLGLSVATIDTHRRNLMVKTEAHNAADLIRYGHGHGLIKADSAT